MISIVQIPQCTQSRAYIGQEGMLDRVVYRNGRHLGGEGILDGEAHWIRGHTGYWMGRHVGQGDISDRDGNDRQESKLSSAHIIVY